MLAKINKRALKTFFFIFTCFSFINAQNSINKRFDIGGKLNSAYKLLFINDTFYIPTTVDEVPFSSVSTSLLKITKTGSLFSALRFKPFNRNFNGGSSALILNKKIYSIGLTDWGLQLQSGLYVFNQKSDTVFTRSYGDTVYYNSSGQILPYLKTKNKLIIISGTDSTCGGRHPGLYKVAIRVVDTNGVLYQTKISNTICTYLSLWDADTTTKKGAIYCGGAVNGGSTKNYVIKLDSNLNEQWNKNIDTGTSLGSSIISLKKGKLLLAHNHSDYNGNTLIGDRITLSKLDDNGNVMWRKRYGYSEPNVSVSRVKECKNGDFILCGQKQLPPSGQQLVGWLMRTDSLGNLKWWHSYTPTNPLKDTVAQNYLNDVLQMPDGGFAAVGWAGGSATFSTVQQTWLLRVDSNGCYQAGCADAVGIIENKLFEEINEITIYPNPANEVLNVEFNNSKNATIKLTVLNALGQIVYLNQSPENKQQIDISTFATGIYFVKIESDAFQKVVKIIKQ